MLDTKHVLGAVVAGLIAAALAYALVIWMPGVSAPYNERLLPDEALAERLRSRVSALSAIGPRRLANPDSLDASLEFIEAELEACGLRPSFEEYMLPENVAVKNLLVDVSSSRSGRLLVVGAHYDTVESPGADDNASGVAALIELACTVSNAPQALRFAFFVNEESPYGLGPLMGSYWHASRLRQERVPVAGMISIESIGYFTNAPDSQRYPLPLSWLYPTRGNFVAFVGDLDGSRLLRRALGRFRSTSQMPSEGITAPRLLRDIGRSDHWSFWMHGYPAIMVTDTVPFRNPNYHRATDTPETLDYRSFGLVVEGLREMLKQLDLG